MKPIAWAIKERIADDDEYTGPWAGIYCNPDAAQDDANALESTSTSRFDVVPVYAAPQSGVREGMLRAENEVIAGLNHDQFLELECLRPIFNAAKMLYDESEEYDFDDGLGKGAPQEYWDALAAAFEPKTAAIEEAITRAADQVNAVRPDCGEAGHADNACGNLQCLPSASQPDTVAVPRDQLEHWAEYWNGSANEKAMSDALEHILGEVDNLLAQEAK